MSNIYNDIVSLLVNTVPSVLAIVDGEGIIQEIYITKKKNVNWMIGKSFKRIVELIFRSDIANCIHQAYLEANTIHQTVELNKLMISSLYNYDEYFQLKCIPRTDYTIVYGKSITESVLIEEEFCTTTQHYEQVNQELNAAMSKLDLYVMDMEQAHKKLSALYQITSVVQKKGSFDELVGYILEGITTEFGFDHVGILLLDSELKILKLKAATSTIHICDIPLGKGIIGYAAQHREVVYVPDARNDSRYIVNNEAILSELAIPLIVDNEVLGVLDVQTCKRLILQKYEMDMLKNLASQIAVTIAHIIYVANVEHEAITDGLTGLYNYRYFSKCLDREYTRALRYSRLLAVLMIDVDYFKGYNDTYGHPKGDFVLKLVADNIKKCVRDVDTVSRYGGEEFAIILPETSSLEACVIAERIRLAIATYKIPFAYHKHQEVLTVSIGVADSTKVQSGQEILKRADDALYEAKKSRNCVSTYKVN